MRGITAIALWGLTMAGCAGQARLTPLPPSATLAERREAGAYKPSSIEQVDNLPVTEEFRGMPLDLSDFRVTFEDEFNHMSVTDEHGKGPWYAPVHSDFGGAKFLPPRPGKGPVFVRDGKLIIQMKQENGKWISTNVQSVNRKGEGFAQQYGYFEMRAKLAPQVGSWGGLWLHSHGALTGPNMPQSEIDIIEAYGGELGTYRSTVHLWPARNPRPGDITKHEGRGARVKMPRVFKDSFFNGFHTFGALVTPEEVIFYYDRKETARLKALPEFSTPLYILMDVTLLKKLHRRAEGIMEMEVDYVRVWQKNGPYSPAPVYLKTREKR